MKYTFQHYVDISTSASTMQIINFNVGGKDVILRCAHLFNAYKYFKLGKVSVKFVPASTLPVDPLGMSYDDEDPQTIDPRDQLNPGLVRITNGEDLFTDLTNVTVEQQNRMYQAMLLDPRWYKFNLQSGFKRTAVPLYWQVGQLHQDQYPGSTMNVPVPESGNVVGTMSLNFAGGTTVTEPGVSTPSARYTPDNSSVGGLFQVGHRGRLGYLPTDAYEFIYSASSSTSANEGWKAMVHNVPSIRTITCVLPKAYKTLYYYRVYITETVYFSGLRSIAPADFGDGTLPDYYHTYRGIDNFISAPGIKASKPTDTFGASVLPNIPTNNGEGDETDN